MRTKFYLTVALLLGFFAVQAQTTKHAIARIFESNYKESANIILVYETGESEVIPLQDWKDFGNNNEVLIENQKIINELLNEMSEKGYEVSKLASSKESESYDFYTFILFTKKE